MTKEVVDTMLEKMNKSVAVYKKELTSMRAGRANPQLLDRILVDYYGTPTPINQVANVSIPDPRIIQIAPWEQSMLKAIEKAIQKSDLGINPSNDGKVIRLLMPELTEERRKEYVKIAKGKAEDGKVAVRNIRRKAKESLDKAIKDGDMGEDEGDRLLKELDKVTKQTTDELDALLETKQKEIMEV